VGMSAVLPALGAGGSLLGGMKGSSAQSQANQGVNAVAGTESNAINQLLQQYFGSAVPGLQGLTGALGSAGGGPGNLISQLTNFSGLSPEQIAALVSSSMAGGQSAVNTFGTQEGGLANPALEQQKLVNQVTQQGAQEGVQLGSLASSQKASTLESGANLDIQGILSALGQQGAPLGSALGGLGGLQSLYSGAAQAQGNPWGSAISGIGSALSGLSMFQPQPSGGPGGTF